MTAESPTVGWRGSGNGHCSETPTFWVCIAGLSWILWSPRTGQTTFAHSLFTCFDQKPTLQCEGFWAPATWPTLTAQTYQSLAPANVIMHECALTHSWELADRAWRSVFVQAGSVLEAQNSGDVLLATGHVQFLAHTAWELDNFRFKVTSTMLPPGRLRGS